MIRSSFGLLITEMAALQGRRRRQAGWYADDLSCVRRRRAQRISTHAQYNSPRPFLRESKIRTSDDQTSVNLILRTAAIVFLLSAATLSAASDMSIRSSADPGASFEKQTGTGWHFAPMAAAAFRSAFRGSKQKAFGRYPVLVEKLDRRSETESDSSTLMVWVSPWTTRSFPGSSMTSGEGGRSFWTRERMKRAFAQSGNHPSCCRCRETSLSTDARNRVAARQVAHRDHISAQLRRHVPHDRDIVAGASADHAQMPNAVHVRDAFR